MNGGVGSTLNLTRVLRVACAPYKARALRGGAWLTLAFALIAPACTGIAPCKKRGLTEACKCEGGGMGTRTCLPELVWDHCECGTLPKPDSGVSGMSGGGAGGAGAVSGGGVSGSSGSMAPGGSGGSSGSGGSTAPNPDDDAGMDMPVDGGTSGSGGSAGSAGMSGSGGSMAPAMPYKACMNASECGMSATCESATDPDDSALMVHACAPACSDASSCPKPAGSYTAMVVCASGHCRIDCSAPLLQDDLTCPSGMRCASDLLGPSYCF
jgi:hypothetical protein